MKKFTYTLCLVFGLFVMGMSTGFAQQSQPQFLLSWQTNAYAPSGFTGKILPSPGTPVTVSFEIVQDGKLVNLAKQTIYWYVNDTLVSNIPGKQTITFIAPSFLGIVDVRIELPSYPGGFLFQSVNIPVVQPEAVIESAYPGGNFTGLSAQVKGVPYFFDVQDPSALSFTWNVNGETPQNAEDPTILSVNLNSDAAPGSAVNVGLMIQAAQDSPDALPPTASANTTLTYVK